MNSKQLNREYHFDTICIFCWGLIGDVFIRVPVIELLKKYYPEARVTCVVDPAGRQVLQNHPDVNSVYVFSRKKAHKFAYIFQAIVNIVRLRRKKFDLSVNLYSGGSSPLISRLINAKIRLGFNHTRSLRWANTVSAVHPSFCQHWTVALAHVLTPLGIEPGVIRRGTSFFVSQTAEAYARNIINNRKCVVINPGAGQKDKQWPVESYVQLAQQINREYGYFPLVITNPGMENLAERFQQLFNDDSRCEILPLLNLDTIGAILKQSIALITGDTSIMHLAFGVKCPTLVLFTYTRPEIVEPEDCLHIPCFIENKSELNTCWKAPGTVSMSVEYVSSRFRLLCDRLSTPN